MSASCKHCTTYCWQLLLTPFPNPTNVIPLADLPIQQCQWLSLPSVRQGCGETASSSRRWLSSSTFSMKKRSWSQKSHEIPMKTIGLFIFLTLRCFALLFVLVTIDFNTIALRVKQRPFFVTTGYLSCGDNCITVTMATITHNKFISAKNSTSRLSIIMQLTANRD